MFDLWKARESQAIHSLLKRIDESAYQVYEMSEKSKALHTGKTKIRFKVVKARNLTGWKHYWINESLFSSASPISPLNPLKNQGKDKSGKSDPYCVVDFEKEIFTTAVVHQNLDPVWDEQITL